LQNIKSEETKFNSKIVFFYYKGNIILTDYEHKILQLLRVRADSDKDVKFAVREHYPVDLAKKHQAVPSPERYILIYVATIIYINYSRIEHVC
jgi:hypothetical protein